MKALYRSTAVLVCHCCNHRTRLFTIHMDDGNHYGQYCALRVSGKTEAQLRQDIRAQREVYAEAARAEYRGTPAFAAFRTPVQLSGSELFAHVEQCAAADHHTKRQIAVRYHIDPIDIF